MPKERKDGRVLIFVKWITLRNGKRIHASWYGKEAFPIWVEPRNSSGKSKDKPDAKDDK